MNTHFEIKKQKHLCNVTDFPKENNRKARKCGAETFSLAP